MPLRLKTVGIAGALAVTMSSAAYAAGEVNIYTNRAPELIEPILAAFTDETGIEVNTVFAKQGIEERLKAEGANTPADLVLTVDVGRLADLVNAGLTQPVMTDTLADNVPQGFHGSNGEWWALTTRGRVFYVSKDRVEEGDISTYEDLADPKWKGRVCTRAGDHEYNVGLIAAMIAHKGEDATREWLKGVKENLARKPQGGDRDQAQAIKEGICDVAIGNTYYMGAMLTNPEQRPWAEAVRIVFPNQDTTGTHVNVSGVVMTKAAPNKDNAVKLMEYLTSEQAQRLYAEANHEFPVKPGVEKSDIVKAWGDFKVDDTGLLEVADYRDEAVKMVNEIGYNDGPNS